MCLATNCIIPFVALRDFTVYKVLMGENTYGINKSPYQGMVYDPNTGYQSEFTYEFPVPASFDKPARIMGVNSGLHAYRSLKAAKRRLHYPEKVVEMTVPKGAVYFIGVNGEIVSNKLVTGSLEAIQ